MNTSTDRMAKLAAARKRAEDNATLRSQGRPFSRDPTGDLVTHMLECGRKWCARCERQQEQP